MNHLTRHLRRVGVIAEPAPDYIARELADFDRRMADVWGMTSGTRAHRCMIMRRLLKAEFASDPINVTALNASKLRTFVLGNRDLSPGTVRVMASTVRCYLRHRSLLGDDVRHLLRAVPKPAKWDTGNLPEGLTAEELDQLLHAFDAPCPSRRRGYAIVRCLVDLGLRTSEVIGLRLDDIDWESGVVCLAPGKGRRAGILPLPVATGEAIVNYILHERPKTDRREIFVRHVGPRGGRVGRRVVQRTLHAAYKRLGWDRTRVHILRHTLGSRLINSGTPIKQIADVLRHRSIQTAADYVRVDMARLSVVALPWPGEVA
ncbi:tyrosine-type recombinase/integrase [Microbacteriaceae bacterium K1510]|nr:tyrosine-type recombinase/integrase [Microbacteriaceae bacterium K1510]